MPKKGQTQPISEEDRKRYQERFDEMKERDPSLTLEEVGRHVGLKKPQVSRILRGLQKQSVQKPQLDRFFGGPPTQDKIVQRIMSVVVRLSETNRHKLHERALALLDEQSRGD